MVIETPRLLLRELTESDAPALLAMYREPDVVRFMGAAPASVSDEIENINAHRVRYYATRGYGLLGVVLRESNALIGRCGLLDVAIGEREEVELSYLLLPAFWGRGFATEAAGAALTFAVQSLGFHRVVAVIQPENARSRRVAERLGMQYDGIVPYKTFGDVKLFVWSGDR